ncbi:MAG: hypothetical protein ACIAQZ_16265 [Sedimentisphaeraceae bacterium JB056]
MRILSVLIAILIVMTTFVSAEVLTLRPVADTFVLEPGVALDDTIFADANDMNFGGSGSQSVASATSRAYSPDESIDDDPKGEFVTLIQFDTKLLEDTKVLGMTLQLNIINGNEKAFGMFNVRGSAGMFDVYIVSNDWKQGNGGPESDDTTGVGVTYNSLAELNTETSPVFLESFYYDAAYHHDIGAVWYDFDFTVSETLFEQFVDLSEDGDVVTLMLIASEDSDVSFNYMGYIQNVDGSDPVYRYTGPKLVVDYCSLPIGDINKDCSVNISDLSLLAANWLADTTVVE